MVIITAYIYILHLIKGGFFVIFEEKSNLEIQFKIQNTLIKIFNDKCVRRDRDKIDMVLNNVMLYLELEKTSEDIEK